MRPVDAALRRWALPPLLRDEPGLTRALGEPDARLAVVEVARPISIAALADSVVTATARGQLPDGHDGRPARRRPRPVPAARRGRALPRLGDAAVRAGQPQRRDDGAAPRHPVAAPRPRTLPGDHRRRRPGAAAEARPGRHDDRADHRATGATRSTPMRSADTSSSSATAARNWSSTAASSHVAARSSTCSRRPPTRPIRIDLWGDEVDRLTRFGVNDQRSTDDLDEVHDLPRPRADADRRRPRPGRRSSWPPSRGVASSGNVSPRAPTSTAWRAGCRGSSTTTSCSPTCCPTAAKVAARRATPDARPGRSISSPRRTTSPARSPRPGPAIPTSRSPACTPTPTRCWTPPARSGRSTPHPSRPTPRWSRRPAGARSPVTGRVSPTVSST